jgi:hypothetical protein
MALVKRTAVAAAVAASALLVGHRSDAGGEAATLALTAAQQEKLKAIQAMFLPGGSTNSGGYGIQKTAEFCGAAIPLEVHPSTVAYETPVRPIDRERISGTCHAAAGALIEGCRQTVNGVNLKKELSANVKKMVCKATQNAVEVDPRTFQAWTFESGTLVFTYLASEEPRSIDEAGMKFLREKFTTRLALQDAARSSFNETMAYTQEELKKELGRNIPITADFENYDPTGKAADGDDGKGGGGKSGGSKSDETEKGRRAGLPYSMTGHSSACLRVARSLLLVASISDGKWKPALLKELKGVTCPFSGFSPRRMGSNVATNESTRAFVERNITFANGVLTLHDGPGLAVNEGPDRVAADVIQDVLATSSLAPAIPLATSGRRNGYACTQPNQCSSFNCSASKCQVCTSDAACGANSMCKEGTCYHVPTAAEREEDRRAQEARDRARAAEPDRNQGGNGSKKVELKGLGEKCGSNFDCKSKHCGTLSSGQLHKCVSKT